MDIFWNIQDRTLVTSLNSLTVVRELTLSSRDTVPISLAIVTPQEGDPDNPFLVQGLAAGQSLIFAAKEDDALDGTVRLFSVDNFVDNGQAGQDKRFTANLNLNTANLLAALGTANERAEIDVTGELTIVNLDASQQDTTSFDVKIKKDVIRGEDDPTSFIVTFPVLEFITDGQGNKGVRLSNADGVPLQDFFPPGV